MQSGTNRDAKGAACGIGRTDAAYID